MYILFYIYKLKNFPLSNIVDFYQKQFKNILVCGIIKKVRCFKMKIFINPSVGSAEPVNGIKESDVTLNIAQRVITHLNAANFTTELKQSDGVKSIYEASNNFGADLFVAINCNSADISVAGTETFYCQGSVKGQKFAQAVQSKIIANVGTVDRGVKDDTQTAAGSLGVLRKTACPAILVELAFISNVNDVQLLRDKQENFANAIASGIMDYCGVAAAANIPNTAPVKEVTESLATKLKVDLNTVASLARKYESDNDLKFFKNDTNDTLYGIYALSSSKKTINAFVDWLCNHNDTKLANYGKALADNEINSEAFIEQWKNLTTVDPGNFGQLQDEFVKTNYFDKAVGALAAEHFHLDKHSDAIKAVVFARSYQNGVNECVNLFKETCKNLNQPNLSYVDDKHFDENLINTIYDSLAKANPSETRLANEKADALSMLKGNSF